MGEDLTRRAEWLSRHILPHEPALRRQLGFWRLPGGLEANDVVQEAYARFASLDSVSDIRNPKSYLFRVARSIVLAHVRRSKIVPMDGLARSKPMISPPRSRPLKRRHPTGNNCGIS